GTEKVLRLGFGGIKDEASHRIMEIGERTPEKTEEMNFLRAVVIIQQAASDFALKHAHEAKRLAEETHELGRRSELVRIAEICRRVSTETPQSFHEALQLFWFACVVMAAENQSCIPIGRLDQDLYPFLERDLESGALTRDEAQELLECLWIKLNFESDLTTDTCRNVTLSGQRSDGGDATNELTYICLDASLHLRLADPKINVRFHEGSPERLWIKCCEMVKEGLGGFPAFYNDEAIIRGLLGMGVPLEDARLYSCDGCQEIILPGRGDFYPVFTGVNLLECVLRTLGLPPNMHDEVDQSSPSETTWLPRTFKEFMEAYAKTVKRAVEEVVKLGNQRDTALAIYSPVPFLSSTLEGCVENARDKTSGGPTYNFTGCNGQCLASAANSLAAIRKLVYDDRRISLKGLRKVLASNWEGNERLRQYALNRVPKFGNDDDYVDSIAVRVANVFMGKVLGYKNPRGGPYYPGFFTFHHVAKGLKINASPDGRRAGDPVSQHLSPAAGTDRSGPTLAINSALKVSALHPPEGGAFDLRFHPSALRGEEGTRNLMSLIGAFMERGGMVIQFNVVDSETLREAQRHPERFRSLIVRVWGFSAYFVTLTKEYQEEIIARTAHS
ncbi:MAG: hypothetical protein NWE79_02930, partial [Candidatus Bathyarchaeota archaeon]|nr:hypothetical protein [Candidatus Bathyarchaeota archaeon]